MKFFSLPVILNTAFALAFSFVLFFAGLAAINIPIWLKILLAAAVAVTLAALTMVKSSAVYMKKNETKILKSEKNAALKRLSHMKKHEITGLFRNLFNKAKVAYREENGCFLCGSAMIVPIFAPTDLNANDIKFMLDDAPFLYDRCYIIANGFDLSATDFCAAERVDAISAENFLPVLKRYGLLPCAVNAAKPKKEGLLRRVMKKVNGIKLIVYGAALFAMSFIVFYPVYYVVSGVIFIVFGLIARFFGKTDPQMISASEELDKIFKTKEF